MKKFLKNKYGVILALLLLTYFSYFTVASFLRYDNFYAGRFDLGNMDQAVWNTMRGRIFQTSSDDMDGISMQSRLAGHADFILIPIAPLYFLWDDPRMLLLLQTGVLAIGALFVYLLSINILKNKPISLVFSFVYLINPGLNYVNLFDFHPVALATTFLLAAFYFLFTKKYKWFLFFSILSGLTKEEVWIIVALFGGYIVLQEQYIRFNKHKKPVLTKATIFGIALFGISSFIFYYLIWHAIPGARGGNHFALDYYKDFGDGPTSIVKNILLSPGKLVNTLIQPAQLDYVYKLFTPLGYLSIFGLPFLLFAVPELLINLLSNNTQLHQIYYQYSSTITPFVFISAILGISFVRKRFPYVSFSFLSVFLMVGSLYSAYFFGPLPFAKYPSLDMFLKVPKNKEFITQFISSVPKRYSVSATNNLGAHLSHRKVIFTLPNGLETSDYVLFLLTDNSSQPSLATEKEWATELKKNSKYKLIVEKDEFLVFKKAPLL